MAQRALRFVIMGAPGAGKGTVSSRLVGDFPSILPVSTGNLLRAHIRNRTPIGQRVDAMVQAGQLVSDELVNEIVHCELLDRCHQHLLLDGYPRTVAQATALDEWTTLSMVINLNVPNSVILDRILSRWIHLPSGRTYHSTYNPPKIAGLDDVTGEPLVRRVDDTTEIHRARLRAYHVDTKLVIDYYRNQGLLYNVQGSTSDEIYPQLRLVVAELLAKATNMTTPN